MGKSMKEQAQMSINLVAKKQGNLKQYETVLFLFG